MWDARHNSMAISSLQVFFVQVFCNESSFAMKPCACLLFHLQCIQATSRIIYTIAG